MTILDSFFILFESDTKKLDKGLGESDKKAEKFLGTLKGVDQQATSVGANFAGLVTRLAGVAGVAIGFGALYMGVKNTAEQYYQLEKLALQFRSTVEAVDEFRDAAGLLGITEQQATDSLRSLEAAVQDTHLGMGRAKKVFEELGVDIHTANGEIKATTDVLGDLAEKFKTMDRGTQIRVMDRLGLDPKLLLLFNSDLGALQKRMTEVDQAAGFNLQLAVKRASEYTKASKALSLELNVLKLFLSKLSEVGKIAALQWLTKGIELATVYVKKFTDFLMAHSNFVKGVFIAIGAAIATVLVPAAISGAVAIWTMLAPFLLIAAAVVGVIAVFALLYEDIQEFRAGNDSLIGDILKKWPMVGEIIEGVGDVLAFVGEVIQDLARIALQVTLLIGGAFGDMIAAFFKPFIQILDLISEAFGGFGGTAGGVLQYILDLISQVLAKFGGVVGIAKSVAGFVRGALGDAKTALSVAPPEAGAFGVAAGRGQLALAGTPADTSDRQSRRVREGLAAAPTPPSRLREGLAAGQAQLRAVSSSPLSSSTSNAVNNSSRRGGDRNVTIDKIEVQTQATDAEGIGRSIGGALGSQLRQANGQFDDGVAA